MITGGNICSRQVLGVMVHHGLDLKIDMDTFQRHLQDGFFQKRISYLEAQHFLT